MQVQSLLSISCESLKVVLMLSIRQCPEVRQAEAIKARHPSAPDLQRTRTVASMRSTLSLGQDFWGQKSSIILVVSLCMVREAPFS